MFNQHNHQQQTYWRIHIGQNCYQINLTTGSCRKMIPTGIGREMRYVRSPLARAIGKSLKLGIQAGRDLQGLIVGMERILNRGLAG